MALGHAPREHTTFGPEHRVAGKLVEGVTEGWAIPLLMWSGVNCVECALLGLHCVGCLCMGHDFALHAISCDKLAILDSTAAHVQPLLVCLPPPPAASVH